MNTCPFKPSRVIGSETITVDNTAGGVSLSSAQYTQQDGPNAADITKAHTAYCTVEAQEIRWNINPAVTVDASSNGHAAAAATGFWLWTTEQILNFRAIRTGGSSGTLRVTYFA